MTIKAEIISGSGEFISIYEPNLEPIGQELIAETGGEAKALFKNLALFLVDYGTESKGMVAGNIEIDLGFSRARGELKGGIEGISFGPVKGSFEVGLKQHETAILALRVGHERNDIKFTHTN